MNEENLRKHKMALLYSQTRELHNLYNSNKISFLSNRYYLIEKQYLENFKKQPDYSKAIEYFKECDCIHNYSTFKKKLDKAFDTDSINLKKNYELYDEENIKSIEKNELTEEISLVKADFLSEFVKNLSKMISHFIYLGNKLIIIKGNLKSSLYFCQLESNEGNYYEDFCVKIIYYIDYNNENILKREIDKIISENKIINIDNYNKGNYVLKDPSGNIYGTLVVLKNINNQNQNNIENNMYNRNMNNNMNSNMNNTLNNSNNNLNNNNFNNKENNNIPLNNLNNNNENKNMNFNNNLPNNQPNIINWTLSINNNNYGIPFNPNQSNMNNFMNNNFNSSGNVINNQMNYDMNVNNNMNNIMNNNQMSNFNNYNSSNINQQNNNFMVTQGFNNSMNNMNYPQNNNFFNNQMDNSNKIQNNNNMSNNNLIFSNNMNNNQNNFFNNNN